jgi:hypothetical protein
MPPEVLLKSRVSPIQSGARRLAAAPKAGVFADSGGFIFR